MCGIAGIVSLSERGVDVRELQAMCSALVHRGPNSVELLLAELDRGRPLNFQLWTLISFEMWCRTFLDRSTSTRSDLTSDTAFDITVAVEGQSRHPVPGPDAVAPSQAPCWTS